MTTILVCGIWTSAKIHENMWVKKLHLKARYTAISTFPAGAFVPSRKAMTCCADDIARIGYMCHAENADQYKNDSWVMVTVTVKTQQSRKQRRRYFRCCTLRTIEPAQPPQEEVVYFG